MTLRATSVYIYPLFRMRWWVPVRGPFRLIKSYFQSAIGLRFGLLAGPSRPSLYGCHFPFQLGLQQDLTFHYFWLIGIRGYDEKGSKHSRYWQFLNTRKRGTKNSFGLNQLFLFSNSLPLILAYLLEWPYWLDSYDHIEGCSNMYLDWVIISYDSRSVSLVVPNFSDDSRLVSLLRRPLKRNVW